MGLPDFSKRASGNSSFHSAKSSLSNDVPLETIGGSSSRRTSRQHVSEATTLGQRIHEDIDNGQYECGICIDKVKRDNSIWFCQRCWSVYHHECIRRCAASRQWKCPSCRSAHTGRPTLTCWCGRQEGQINKAGLPPNSCDRHCFKSPECFHVCFQRCHAGPCQPCTKGCVTNPRIRQEMALRLPPEVTIAGDRIAPIAPAPARNPDIERAAPRPQGRAWGQPRAMPDPFPSLVRRIIKRHLVCIFLNLLMIIAVSIWTVVIVEPFRQPSTTENTKAVRAIWAVLGIFGFIIMSFNGCSLSEFKKTGQEIGSRLEARLPSLTSILGRFTCVLWDIIRLWLYLVWVVWPFFSAVFLPMVARLLYFRHVCDGFDTRIILDIGGSPVTRADHRKGPIFKDLSPDALPSYTMVVASNDTDKSQSSMELNYYLNALNEVLGITQTPESPPPLRTTTITDARIDMSFTQVHTKDTNEVNPSELYRKRIGKIFVSTIEDYLVVKINVTESPGFYRVIYDNVRNTWATQIGAQPQYNGTFTSQQHLIFPSLGLQVPNFFDYARTCKLEPFLKMHRGTGALAEIERQGKESYRYDGGDVVLRTVAFGLKQRKLEICARRRDVVTSQGIILKGLGDKLPVVAGLLASVRYLGDENGRQENC